MATAKRRAVFAALATFFIPPAMAAQVPANAVDWAYPALVSRGAETPPTTLHRLPGSSHRFTEAEVHDLFQAVDWYGEGGVASPRIVGHGRAPTVMACGFCHLPTGQGRPENAPLAGLPARYIEEQLEAMRTGSRKGARPTYAPTVLMHEVAANVTPPRRKPPPTGSARGVMSGARGWPKQRSRPRLFPWEPSTGSTAPRRANG